MQLALDKKVFNVGKDLSSRGGSAVEILDNVPSVQVDIEGNISLRGSSNVRILVDGKPSGLVGTGGSGLRSLQANMIEKVEVITNPSARYEAEGMAGIINIILKKEVKKGLNGSFEVTAGVPKVLGTAANLNYRTSKLNFFVNYNIRQREGPGVGSLYQEVFRSDTTFITEQDNKRLRGGLSQTVRLGADYFFNEKNTLTTSFSYRISDDKNFAETRYDDYINSLDNLVESSIRTDDEKEDETKLEYAIDYEKKFDREGQSWKTRISYQDNIEEEGSILENRFLDGTLFLEQESNNKERENTLIFQSDYVVPFSKDQKFEVGGRASIRNIDNDFLVEELRDNVWEPLEGLSNNFQYDEKIYAAYVIYGDKIDNVSYQVGLRPEYTDVNTTLLTTNEENPRDYVNLFPSAFLGYEFGKNNTLQLSYSRRVRRPRFWDLNPFFTFSDNRNFFSGNPDLDPEFTDAFELGHLKFWDKASLSSAVYYRYTTGVIERIQVVNPDGTSVTKPQNLSTRNAYGLEFNGSYNPKPHQR